jgi:hypothetical protein
MWRLRLASPKSVDRPMAPWNSIAWDNDDTFDIPKSSDMPSSVFIEVFCPDKKCVGRVFINSQTVVRDAIPRGGERNCFRQTTVSLPPGESCVLKCPYPMRAHETNVLNYRVEAVLGYDNTSTWSVLVTTAADPTRLDEPDCLNAGCQKNVVASAGPVFWSGIDTQSTQQYYYFILRNNDSKNKVVFSFVASAAVSSKVPYLGRQLYRRTFDNPPQCSSATWPVQFSWHQWGTFFDVPQVGMTAFLRLDAHSPYWQFWDNHGKSVWVGDAVGKRKPLTLRHDNGGESPACLVAFDGHELPKYAVLPTSIAQDDQRASSSSKVAGTVSNPQPCSSSPPNFDRRSIQIDPFDYRCVHFAANASGTPALTFSAAVDSPPIGKFRVMILNAKNMNKFVNGIDPTCVNDDCYTPLTESSILSWNISAKSTPTDYYMVIYVIDILGGTFNVHLNIAPSSLIPSWSGTVWKRQSDSPQGCSSPTWPSLYVVSLQRGIFYSLGGFTYWASFDPYHQPPTICEQFSPNSRVWQASIQTPATSLISWSVRSCAVSYLNVPTTTSDVNLEGSGSTSSSFPQGFMGRIRPSPQCSQVETGSFVVPPGSYLPLCQSSPVQLDPQSSIGNVSWSISTATPFARIHYGWSFGPGYCGDSFYAQGKQRLLDHPQDVASSLYSMASGVGYWTLRIECPNLFAECVFDSIKVQYCLT